MNNIQIEGPESSIAPVELSVVDVKKQVEKIQNLMRSVMHEGEHYGIIPGTKKPSLLKSGAEKLCFTFRLAPKFRINEKDLGNGHREYVVECVLKNMNTGMVVGTGVGSCSTMEKKYRYRYMSGKQVDNPDIADVYNTVLKIAKKRAHVDATITACAASDIFTQDVEDMEPADEREKVSTYNAQIAKIMTATYKNGLPVFNDNERQEVRGIVQNLHKSKDIDAFRKLIIKYSDMLDARTNKQDELLSTDNQF